MAKLAQLMGHDHPLFVFNIAQLEKATGGAGVDTRLIADITERSHQVMRALVSIQPLPHPSNYTTL